MGTLLVLLASQQRGWGGDAKPMLFDLSLDKNVVAPGQPVTLTAVAPKGMSGELKKFSIESIPLANWDGKTRRFVGDLIPIGWGGIGFSEAQFPGFVGFDTKIDGRNAVVREYRPTFLGVYITWYELTISDETTTEVMSFPRVVVVRPPENTPVKPEWLVKVEDEDIEKLLSRKFAMTFTVTADKPEVPPGQPVRLAVPAGTDCLGALRIGRYVPKPGGFTYFGIPENVDLRDDLGLEGDLKPFERDGTIHLKPKRLGVYLLSLTRREKPGAERTESFPVVVVVYPPVGADGKSVVKPEWVPPVQDRKKFDIESTCEKEAVLTPRK